MTMLHPISASDFSTAMVDNSIAHWEGPTLRVMVYLHFALPKAGEALSSGQLRST